MIKERLDLILKELSISGRKFEKACGLANGSYSSIGDGVGADKLNKILINFPQISADWLLTGKGEMLKKNAEESQITEDNSRLWALIESQARTIESQQRTIEAFAQKGGVGAVPGVASTGGRR